MRIAARSSQDFGAKRGPDGPSDGAVILPSLLISLVFFGIFGSNPRLVVRISRAAATITATGSDTNETALQDMLCAALHAAECPA